jgi:hypothetical protein
MYVIRSAITGNRGDVGAIENRHVARIEDSAITENVGESIGAIRNHDLALLLMRESMLSRNTAADVGALVNHDGKAVLTRTSLTGNAAQSVGALRNEGSRTVALVDCSVAGNDGKVSGLHNQGMGSLSLHRTFILDECHGTITSNGENVMQGAQATCGFDKTKGDVPLP